MKLIALNLPRDFTEEDLAKLFKAQGNIKSCNLVMDEKTGNSKGFGFVEMALEHEGKEAIVTLHGSQVEGQSGREKIRVKAAD